MNSLHADQLGDWIGRRKSVTDIISPGPIARLSALLDRDSMLASAGDILPPCWHWLYFLDAVQSSELGEDGHPRRGGFLPPIPLPRRMWAGSHIQFHLPLRVGDALRRESSIAAIAPKQGRSGPLVFVQVDHQIYRGDELLLEEQQDIVYREAQALERQTAEPGGKLDEKKLGMNIDKNIEQNDGELNEQDSAQIWRRQLTPDEVMLFRYSALTFNAHRIHYDRNYAVNGEGYPGLVMQGPLTATLLLDLLHRQIPNVELVSFAFRGKRPLYEGDPVNLHGILKDSTVDLVARNDNDDIGMIAEAKLRS